MKVDIRPSRISCTVRGSTVFQVQFNSVDSPPGKFDNFPGKSLREVKLIPQSGHERMDGPGEKSKREKRKREKMEGFHYSPKNLTKYGKI